MYGKVLLTGLAVVSMALAQSGMGGDAGGGMSGRGVVNNAGSEQDRTPGGQTGRAPKESKADMMVSRLKLNKDQKSELETILDSTQKEATPVIQQVMEARQKYASALVSGKSEAELEPLLKAMNEAQFEMTGVEVKAFQRIVAQLKPNQVAKAPEAFDLMSDIFMPTSMGGGGGGGMGRRGGGGGGR